MTTSLTSTQSNAAAASTTTSSSSAGSLQSSLGASANLGEADFLKLLVAQLQNQDPLAPQDNTQFVAQLAQFSSLEQEMGINSRLDTLTAQSKGLASTDAVGLVGQVATANGATATLDGSGAGAAIDYTLGSAAADTKIQILDSSGNAIRTIDAGPQRAGLTQVQWDGKSDTGTLQPAGTYTVAVSATNTAGGAVAVDQNTTGIVQAVSFSTGSPVLELNNGVSVPISDLLEVDSPATTQQ
jgi:flagellar basal-body rod modification protein FlgD